MSEWNTLLLKNLGFHYGGLTKKTKKDFGKGSKYIPYLNIFENPRINAKDFELVEVSHDEQQNKVEFGDVFFTVSSETPDELGMSSVLLDKVDELYLNSFCFGFRLNDFNTLRPEYAIYLFRSRLIRKIISNLAQGSTRYNLSKAIFFEKMKFSVPETNIQIKIAKILSICDSVIAKTESAIEKYQAIKQGMMNDLFTRGIDVNTGKLRPSYDEQPELYKPSELGWIPKDWESFQMLDLTKVSQGLQIPISSRFKEEKDNRFLYITVQFLNNLNSDAYRYYIENPPQSVICHEDDILMVRTGNTGEIISHIIGCFHNNFFKIDYDKKLIQNYLIYFLKRHKIQRLIMNYAGTTTIPDLKHGDFYKLPVNLPKNNEQIEITNKLTQIDTLIDKEQSTLRKYQQIKAGLMQDLLTGKVEVSV